MHWQIRPAVFPVRAIHPIAVRMVYEAANAVNVPIIGMAESRRLRMHRDALSRGECSIRGNCEFLQSECDHGDCGWHCEIYGTEPFCKRAGYGWNCKIAERKKGVKKSDTSFFHVCGHSLKDAVICCDIVVKVLYDRCHMVCFQSSHIKLSFPVSRRSE